MSAHPPDIVIIGGGFSGLMAAVQLLDRLPDAQVRVVETRPRLGPGAAYSATDPRHLLNVRAASMGAFAGQPQGFAEWLTAAGGGESDQFWPRELYGRYLLTLADQALARPGLEHVRGEAVAATSDAEGWRVDLADGRRLRADVLVLALGNPPPAPPAGIDADLLASPLYSADPWSPGMAAPSEARRVLLIGTGLTMVDAALSLGRPGRQLVALSRRGLTPRPHPSQAAPAPGHWFEGGPRQVLARARALARQRPWTAVMEDLRAQAAEIWRSWPDVERRRFLRHLRPWWDIHRHRLAPAVADTLGCLRETGGLEVRAGRIRRLSLRDGAAELTWRPRGSPEIRTERFDAVVNCTGPALDLAAAAGGSPLLSDLLARRLIQPDPNGLGLAVDDSWRVLRGEGWADASCYALGALTRGRRWETTAAPELREQAAQAADSIAEALRRRGWSAGPVKISRRGR